MFLIRDYDIYAYAYNETIGRTEIQHSSSKPEKEIKIKFW